MTEQEFKHLVASLELDAGAEPAAYRRRTILLAAVGYLYIYALLAINLAGLYWAVQLFGRHHYFSGGKVLLVCGVASLLLVRALWVRLEPPKGIAIGAEQAPHLFNLIEQVRAKCNGPKVHKVLLVEELNASICQTPRLGLLGWYHNTLTLGLPLMQTLSTHQLASVIAHEYGHLVGAHGKTGAWIYRIRISWGRTMEALEDDNSPFSRFMLAFLRWYIPYFQAYSFVLARQQEYEADRLAASIAGPRNAADALITIALQSRFLHETFWPKIWQQIERTPAPALMPHAGMATALKLGQEAASSQDWLNAAMRERTGSVDTHPCLRERLEALEQKADIPAPPAHSAAQTLLQGQLGKLIQRVDREWWNEYREHWVERHRAIKAAEAVLTELDSRDENELNPEDATRLGLARLTLDGEDTALPILLRAADLRNGTARAAWHAGEILLKRDDPRGVDYLEMAISRDAESTLPALLLALEFFERTHNEARAEVFRERLQRATGAN